MAREHRREHPTATVRDGGRVVTNPVASIEAFNATWSPKSPGRIAPVHPSTGVDQFSGRGHSTTSQKLPPVPIRADDNSGKKFDPVPTHPSMGHDRGEHGYTKEDIAGHAASMALCDEAVHSGSARLPGECPHWRPKD